LYNICIQAMWHFSMPLNAAYWVKERYLFVKSFDTDDSPRVT
jgi:lysophospholipid acyltransferase (LPLAT)-like uncharacterized protein